MLEKYTVEAEKRQSENLPPLSLTASETRELTADLEAGHSDSATLLQLLAVRVDPGVSKAAQVKAEWLEKVALAEITVAVCNPEMAISMLAQMGGGYNVVALIRLLQNEVTAQAAADAMKGITKIYESFDEIVQLARNNAYAKDLLESWARADWFNNSPAVPETLTLTLYKVEGEINTDDFSPGNQAQSRADVPLHATFFGKSRFPEGVEKIQSFREQGKTVGFAGDVVGTGSSRKSAINSLVWHIGEDIPAVPNKRTGGVVIGGIIAPIFYATARDAGVLPIQCDVTKLETGDEVTLNLKAWKLTKQSGEDIPMQPAPATLLDEYRAGGRLNLIIGRNLTKAACEVLSLPFPAFQNVVNPTPKPNQGYTLAQKMVGRACGVEGVLPGTVCEPKITTVGSQDTTGPMTMQEIAELACLRFKADLFMQSFCHTAAYPKVSDPGRWQTMTETTKSCGGVVLKPGDGVIHSWINRMLIPDTVGTGGDSHTRFPLGISFPAGSGLVAFAGALGFMPLEMPQSIRVRFHGKRKPGITVRDMVNAIPYAAIQQSLLTVAKKGKKNIFAGTVLEIEGIDDLSVEEAFELSDASAERSAAASTLKLPLPAVIENVKANVELLKSLVADGYSDKDCLVRRIEALEEWLQAPHLLAADENAEYLAEIDIDLAELTEPLLACPNDPDDVRALSEVSGTAIDEAFIGSCMVHIGHLQRAAQLVAGKEYAKSQLWVAPPTRMARDILLQEGSLSNFSQVGGRVEIPGCSLCMGNQARVRPGATVMSTSTRNFDNRLGDGAQVFLGSTELTVYAALYGALPTVEEYFQFVAG
jgi:aconitate hydratase 2/2-methylisocitrate dehydratase